MTPQGEALQIGLVLWIALLAAMVAYRMLSGRISLTGLLASAPEGVQGADRMQMLLFTLGGAATYLGAAIKVGGFPEVPDWALVVGGASQGVYLMGKQARAK